MYKINKTLKCCIKLSKYQRWYKKLKIENERKKR